MTNRGIVRRFRIRSFRTLTGRLSILLTVSAARLHRTRRRCGRRIDRATVSGGTRKRAQHNGNDQKDADKPTHEMIHLEFLNAGSILRGSRVVEFNLRNTIEKTASHSNSGMNFGDKSPGINAYPPPIYARSTSPLCNRNEAATPARS